MAKVEFTGNIGRDAELGFSQSGTPNLKFNVADTKGKKDAQGNWDKQQEKTQWFRCTLWGPDAEHYAERLKQGALVTVFGELMESKYTDREGVARSSMDVTVRGLSVANKRGAESAINTAQPSAWEREQQSAGDAWANGAAQTSADPQGWGAQPANQYGQQTSPPF